MRKWEIYKLIDRNVEVIAFCWWVELVDCRAWLRLHLPAAALPTQLNQTWWWRRGREPSGREVGAAVKWPVRAAAGLFSLKTATILAGKDGRDFGRFEVDCERGIENGYNLSWSRQL